jgi:hypothetical protein
MTNMPKKREGTSPVYIKYSSNQEENYLLWGITRSLYLPFRKID